MQLLASPCSHVTVSEQTRITAGIPAGAVFFCFCYPLAATSYMLNQSSDTVSEAMKARMAALQAKEDQYYDERYNNAALANSK